MKNKPEIYEEIAEVSDEKTARKIAELFQGCQVYFPLWDRSERTKERDKAIYRDYRKGLTYFELANKYALTERRIRVIVNEYAEFRQLKFQL